LNVELKRKRPRGRPRSRWVHWARMSSRRNNNKKKYLEENEEWRFRR
jgi:hypothetical protein